MMQIFWGLCIESVFALWLEFCFHCTWSKLSSMSLVGLTGSRLCLHAVKLLTLVLYEQGLPLKMPGEGETGVHLGGGGRDNMLS